MKEKRKHKEKPHQVCISN